MERAKTIVVVGANASGKTMLTDRWRRQWASQRVRYIAFDDAYGPATDRAFYLQQRWNQHDIDPETPTVGELLEHTFLLTGPDDTRRRGMQHELYGLFGLEPLLDKYIILLSSGELRKYQLAKTLLAEPTTLIIDNPFIGLDSNMRNVVRNLLATLPAQRGITLYLVLARKEEIPSFADEVIGMEEQKQADNWPLPLVPGDRTNNDETDNAPVVDINDITVRYGERIILRNLSWRVMSGERWALTGENGSGKTTLLSLICADNPQAYACDISLFGLRRGSGETVWDIKRRIGYVSPEIHRSYRRAIPALHVVASGLKDTVGLYVRPTIDEREVCRRWMDVFRVGHLAERLFTTLSSGEQRLVLLARAFVKEPQLLVLDEPLHGLDDNNRQYVLRIIETYCQQPGKTLIMVSHYEDELPACINNRLTLSKQQ